MDRRAPLYLLSAALGFALGCSKSPASLIGPVEDIVSMDGVVFGTGTSKDVPFRGGATEAQSVAGILLRGRSAEDLKFQGAAAFSLIRKDGRKVSVEVTKPGNVVRIDGTSFSVDMPALMAILQAAAK